MVLQDAASEIAKNNVSRETLFNGFCSGVVLTEKPLYIQLSEEINRQECEEHHQCQQKADGHSQSLGSLFQPEDLFSLRQGFLAGLILFDRGIRPCRKFYNDLRVDRVLIHCFQTLGAENLILANFTSALHAIHGYTPHFLVVAIVQQNFCSVKGFSKC